MNIKLIACVGANGGIGKNGDLLFNIKEDLKRFKKLTEGHVVVMGRKTYESLPNGPLKNRTNIVLSRKYPVSKDYVLYNSVENFLIGARHHPDVKGREIYVIGGQEIYEQFISHANVIELTEVKANKRADAFFATIDLDEWRKTYQSESMTQGKLEYTYNTYHRKNKL